MLLEHEERKRFTMPGESLAGHSGREFLYRQASCRTLAGSELLLRQALEVSRRIVHDRLPWFRHAQIPELLLDNAG